MKKIRELFKKMKNNRKLRCGGFSAVLTVGVVICALLVGALADGLEKRFALQADLSFNGATTQGAVTKAALAQLDKNVHLYALAPASGGDETLLSLLDRYSAASDRVTVSRENLVRNPVLQSQFSDGLGENQVTEECLIVSCPETGRARILTAEDYVLYSYNMDTGYFDEVSYSYEKSVTEAILYVTQDDVPAVQILSGHGEKSESEIEAMTDTLISANYQVKWVNLAAGEALDPQSPLMILCPKYDLAERELNQLMDFARAGGDFFIVSQYSDPRNLDHFQAFLRAWGIESYPGMVIAKEEDTGSYYADSPVILMPYMQETDATRPLIAGGEDILLLTAARAFKLPDREPEGVMLSPVLMTGEAYIRNYEDGLNVTQQQPGDEEGRFCVALWSDKMLEDGTVSHAFVLGDMTMFLNYWMQGSTSSTAFLLQMVRSLQGQEPLNLDIVPITAQRETLALGNITPAVIVTVMLPLLVLLGALLVLWPRKNL
ncbi:MAG: Gldg family protein [Clostridia bacterium]|nr:Gldg family protein [Clostridia bacterium]